MSGFAQKAMQARLATLLLLGLLILLLLLGTVLLAPAGATTTTIMVVMAIKTLPLLLFLWPIHKMRALGGVWLSLLLMPYLCLAVLGSLEPGWPGVFAQGRILLILACCSAALLLTRWQKKASDTQTLAG